MADLQRGTLTLGKTTTRKIGHSKPVGGNSVETQIPHQMAQGRKHEYPILSLNHSQQKES